MRTARRTTAVLLLAILVLPSCGAREPAGPGAGAGGEFPVTITDARGETTLEEAPRRIVSLSPTSTEILFAIGAGEQVVAADEHSNHPEEAPDTELSGFTPSVEAIAEHEPDLVILARDAEDAAEQLERIEIPVVVLPAGEVLEDTYDQMRLLGEATGHSDEAEEAADQVEAELDGIVAETREQTGDVDLSYYHELDDAMYSVNSGTFIGQVYERFGLSNIADAAGDEADGYPQLSAEFVVAEDPDLIFLSHGGVDAVASLEERPAFDTISAVQNGDVVTLDPDIASRWGPRVVELAQSVSEAVIAAEET
ncbi:ABC transporter substrate-binding protein [Allosalinactinospora lopnorensis]|uniref:ABC transporter substrate-binding protein n=1 Tax=Allosalinactinospora lopnorensis TaxID=1352348 RepID=UPI000623E345|nr:ABC transporter substrate-binding protein [Allosalinactinospora lopnorensis]